MPGPDLPEPHELFDVEHYFHRWPSGAHKVELVRGILLFSGQFDDRDVEIAQRAYSGRQVLINEDGSLEVHPASDDPPQTIWEKHYRADWEQRYGDRIELGGMRQRRPRLS